LIHPDCISTYEVESRAAGDQIIISNGVMGFLRAIFLTDYPGCCIPDSLQSKLKPKKDDLKTKSLAVISIALFLAAFTACPAIGGKPL
jgi:hypothetical protein